MYFHARPIRVSGFTRNVNSKTQYRVTVSLSRNLNLAGRYVEELSTFAIDSTHAIERAYVLMHGDYPRNVSYVELGNDEAELTITR